MSNSGDQECLGEISETESIVDDRVDVSAQQHPVDLDGLGGEEDEVAPLAGEGQHHPQTVQWLGAVDQTHGAGHRDLHCHQEEVHVSEAEPVYHVAV